MEVRDIGPRGWLNWDLDRTFGSFERDLNRLFRDLRHPFENGGNGLKEFHPKINVSENDKAINVTAELPGLDEKDVKVTLNEGA